jgi:hypothetical protein
MARRTRNRLELRDQYEAAEAREKERLETGDAEEADEADEADEGADGAAPAKKPAKKKAAPKEAKPKRSRTTKAVRQRIVWVVFDNSSKAVTNGRFPYPQKREAEELAAKLQADKKQTYYVQPVKEPIEE